MKKPLKTETVAEFLARGGKITRLDPGDSSKKVEGIKPAAGGPVTILSMDDAGLYYGEIKSTPKKSKKTPTIDINALPEELRKRYIDGLLNEQEKEADED